jgi:hypothetical protein
MLLFAGGIIVGLFLGVWILFVFELIFKRKEEGDAEGQKQQGVSRV